LVPRQNAIASLLFGLDKTHETLPTQSLIGTNRSFNRNFPALVLHLLV
jgi:hypothetical protein